MVIMAHRVVAWMVCLFLMAQYSFGFSFKPSFTLGRRQAQLQKDDNLKSRRAARQFSGPVLVSMQVGSGEVNRDNGGEEKLRLWKEKAKAARKPTLQQGMDFSLHPWNCFLT
eukprot:67223-Hanusia_phi.AAC.1